MSDAGLLRAVEPRPGDASVAEELMQAVSRLRRAVRRTVRRDWPHRPLTESEHELIRLVRATPGLRVQEAASALGLAPNTVSTLVGELCRQGLLERRADPADGRVARLHLTAAATRRISAWRDRRQQLVARELARLRPHERAALKAALPSLWRLVDALEAT